MHNYEGTANVHLQFMDGYVSWRLHPETSCQLLCPYAAINIAMSNNFKYSHVQFTQFFFSVIKLDLVIQALLLGYIIALEKTYVYALRASCCYIEINIFEHF